MQKNGRRPIPDFSKKRPGKPSTPQATGQVMPSLPPVAPAIKPKATSAKSGRRGQ